MGILDACELSSFEPETAKVFENAIERLFYSESFRIGKAILPQSRVRSRLHLLDGMILREAESKLHANMDRPVGNSTAYTMATIVRMSAMLRQLCSSASDVRMDGEFVYCSNAKPDFRRLESVNAMLELSEGRPPDGRLTSVLLLVTGREHIKTTGGFYLCQERK